MCNVEGPPLKKARPALMPSGEPIPIYLDYNATTPLGKEAFEALVGHAKVYGNPSSVHPYGLEAKFALDQARQTIGDALGIKKPENEILFTSGGTESNNLAIFGTLRGIRQAEEAAPDAGGHKGVWKRRIVVTSNFEHPAVEKVMQLLETDAAFLCQVLRVPVNNAGQVTGKQLRGFLTNSLTSDQLKNEVAMFTFMHANNEIGTVNPISELVKVSKELCPGSYFHTDAAQSLGKVPLPGHREEEQSEEGQQVLLGGVDLLSICGHKFYAPKGSGALYVREGVPLSQITCGADHERGLRPGTENVLFCSALAAALSAAVRNQKEFADHCARCRIVLYDTLQQILTRDGFGIEVNGSEQLIPQSKTVGGVEASTKHTLPNTLSIAIRQLENKDTGLKNTYISAARLIQELGHIVAMSAGSACHSTAEPDEPVHVSGTLIAIGCSTERAIGTLRLSCGKMSTEDEMRRAGKFIARRAIQQVADW